MFTGELPWNLDFQDPTAVMFRLASSKEGPEIPEELSDQAKDFLRLCFLPIGTRPSTK
eukprot:gene24355-10387_t